VEKLGKDQYKLCHQSVITDKTTSIHGTIKKNNLSVLSKPTLQPKGKQGEQISMLEHNVELFAAPRW